MVKPKSLLINLDTIFTKSECKLTLRHENNVLIKEEIVVLELLKVLSHLM